MKFDMLIILMYIIDMYYDEFPECAKNVEDEDEEDDIDILGLQIESQSGLLTLIRITCFYYACVMMMISVMDFM
jgi:hypothetical protein